MKIKYNNLKSFEKYNHKYAIDYDKFTKSLFHGTRRYVIDCEEIEIIEMKKHCDKVLSFMRDNIYSIDQDMLFNYIKKSKNNINCSPILLYNHTNYTYDGFYLTTSYMNAINYSCNVFGEIGEYAYKCAKAIKDMNIFTENVELQESINYVFKEYEKIVDSEKVILAVRNVKYSDLTREGGSSIVKDDFNPLNDEDVESFKWNVEFMYDTEENDDCTMALSFTLKNYNDYEIEAIPEDKIIEGINVFTDIEKIGNELDRFNSR